MSAPTVSADPQAEIPPPAPGLHDLQRPRPLYGQLSSMVSWDEARDK
jgi:hypothetical protein